APAAALTVEAHRGGGWLVRVAGDAVDWRHPQAPDEALARWQEVLALAGGIAWTLLDRTAGHAAERPLFGRWLADFPAVQLRLVLLQLRVLVVEESAALLAGTPSAALRAQWRRELDAVRIDAQQLCGGTGYMRETAFADTLLWHEWADTAARQCLCPEQPGPAGGVMHEALRERLRRRLMQACPTEANWAAQWLPA
ncbi:acyl-CoA dehydrogenase family protein, partial [Chitiniphilus shinanonensis]